MLYKKGDRVLINENSKKYEGETAIVCRDQRFVGDPLHLSIDSTGERVYLYPKKVNLLDGNITTDGYYRRNF